MAGATAVGATAVFGVPAAGATTYNVTSLNDGNGQATLRGAIGQANSHAGPDIVNASTLSGTIRLTNGEITVTDDVQINGPGNNQLTISGDANGNGQPNPGVDSSIFYFGEYGGSNITATLSGLKLTGAVSGLYDYYSYYTGDYYPVGLNGGAVFAAYTDLTISGSTLTDNVATGSGAAISAFDSDALTLDNTQITGNTAGGSGGGVYVSAYAAVGDLDMTNSTVSGNQSQGQEYYSTGYYYDYASGDGAGISAIADSATITGSTISGNEASDYDNSGYGSTARGGGLNLNAYSTEIDRSTISGNSATASAGGAFVSGEATLSDSTISDNSVEGTGGGLLWTAADETGLTVEQSTISGNQAGGGGSYYGSGGGLATFSVADDYYGYYTGPVEIRNSTIAGNSADDGGSGIYDHGYSTGDDLEPVSLSSTIVGGNAGDDDLLAEGDSTGFVAGHSLIQHNPGVSTLVTTPANTNVFAVDPKLGALAANGGPTETMLPLAGSPVIDAGIANAFTVDQRGAGFNRRNDAAVAQHTGSDATDIGAVETADDSGDQGGGNPGGGDPGGDPGGGGTPGGGALSPDTGDSGGSKAKCKKKKKKGKHKAGFAKKKKCKKKKRKG